MTIFLLIISCPISGLFAIAIPKLEEFLTDIPMANTDYFPQLTNANKNPSQDNELNTRGFLVHDYCVFPPVANTGSWHFKACLLQLKAAENLEIQTNP